MLSLIAFARPGIGEILLVALVILVIFGAQRLPEIGRAAGKAIRNFQRAFRGQSSEDKTPDSSDTN